jgi:hypothetical protein
MFYAAFALHSIRAHPLCHLCLLHHAQLCQIVKQSYPSHAAYQMGSRS